jgi:hypothetical protein
MTTSVYYWGTKTRNGPWHQPVTAYNSVSSPQETSYINKIVFIVKHNIKCRQTCSKIRIAIRLSDTFLANSGLEQGDGLLQLFVSFTSEYANKKVQANQEGLKLNGTH